MARHGGSSVSAFGSPKFVAGALVAHAVVDAIAANGDFNDCMQASGFVIADGQPQLGANSPVPVQQNVAYMPAAVAPPDPPELADCLQPLRANSYYEPILPHLPDPYGEYTASQLSDPTLPTPQERTIAASYHDLAKPCMDGFIAEAQMESPSAAGLMIQAEAERKNELLAFVSGSESWGEYATHQQKIRVQLASRLHGAYPL